MKGSKIHNQWDRVQTAHACIANFGTSDTHTNKHAKFMISDKKSNMTLIKFSNDIDNIQGIKKSFNYGGIISSLVYMHTEEQFLQIDELSYWNHLDNSR